MEKKRFFFLEKWFWN